MTQYYAYFDLRKRQYYFHDPISNVVTWELPKDQTILYADTMKPYLPPKEIDTYDSDFSIGENMLHTLPMRKKKADFLRQTITPPIVHDDMSVRVRRRRKDVKRTLSSSLHIDGTLDFSGGVAKQLEFYFPPTIVEDQKLADIHEFAKQNFRVYQKGSLFKKENINPDELFQADKHLNCYPLLKTTDSKRSRDINTLFQFILNYAKGDQSLKPSQFAHILSRKNELIDELYILIIKQTRNNSNIDALHRTWDMMLVMSTLFIPTKNVMPLVRTVLAQTANGSNKRIALPAQLAYIRFVARCESGTNLRQMDDDWINTIPNHKNVTHFTIGASLYELLWQQRRTHPFCPFPIFIHKICEALFRADCDKVEGTFRLPGNAKEIDELVKALDSGEDIFDDTCEITNLASLLKMWIRELPESIVPPQSFPALLECRKSKNYMPILEQIPRVNRETLAYLIGFLKKFLCGVEVTKMGMVPVCMIFGQNVVRLSVNNQDDVRICTEIGRDLMEQLLKEWDVSFAYPIPEGYLKGSQ